MSLPSNDSQVYLGNSQSNMIPDPNAATDSSAAPDPNTVPDLNAVINAPLFPAILQQLVVFPNQGVGLALVIHENVDLCNPTHCGYLSTCYN